MKSSIDPLIFNPSKIKELVSELRSRFTDNSVKLVRIFDNIGVIGFKSNILEISQYQVELKSIILLGILFNNNLNILARKKDPTGYTQLNNHRNEALKNNNLLGKIAHYLEYSQNPLLNEINMGKLYYFCIKSLKQANRIIDFPQAYVGAINDHLRNNLEDVKALINWYDSTPNIMREYQLKIIFSNFRIFFPTIRMKNPVSIAKSVWGDELVLIRFLEKNLTLMENELQFFLDL